MIENIERPCEIICYVLNLIKETYVSKAKIIKILFLLELIKSRQGIYNFTGLTFKNYYSGAYPDMIENCIDLLKSLKCIEIEDYNIQLKRIADFGQLTNKEKKEINEIVLPLSEYNKEMLFEITQNTKEIQETLLGETINFYNK